jgi:hypothetical protein
MSQSSDSDIPMANENMFDESDSMNVFISQLEGTPVDQTVAVGNEPEIEDMSIKQHSEPLK